MDGLKVGDSSQTWLCIILYELHFKGLHKCTTVEQRALFVMHAPTWLIHIALCWWVLNQHVKNCFDLTTWVTTEARLSFWLVLKPRMMYVSLGHLAVGFVLVTRLLSVAAAGGVMDAAGASCSYMMEGDFQLCWHQLAPLHREVWWVFTVPPCCRKHNTKILMNKFYHQNSGVSLNDWYLFHTEGPEKKIFVSCQDG